MLMLEGSGCTYSHIRQKVRLKRDADFIGHATKSALGLFVSVQC